jgi:DNA-directed RNA polymerase specialized sigma24 family protein
LLVAFRILNMAGHEESLRRVAAALETSKERRDAAIVKASDAGLSRRRVAGAVGLSVGRVQQILEERGAR